MRKQPIIPLLLAILRNNAKALSLDAFDSLGANSGKLLGMAKTSKNDKRYMRTVSVLTCRWRFLSPAVPLLPKRLSGEICIQYAEKMVEGVA